MKFELQALINNYFPGIRHVKFLVLHVQGARTKRQRDVLYSQAARVGDRTQCPGQSKRRCRVHLPLKGKAIDATVRNFREYIPDHTPLRACVGVSRLGEDDMRVEIEVPAHDPEGAKGV